MGESAASTTPAAAAGGKGKSAAEAAGLPPDDMAFDQGLRRMRPGKIGKVGRGFGKEHVGRRREVGRRHRRTDAHHVIFVHVETGTCSGEGLSRAKYQNVRASHACPQGLSTLCFVKNRVGGWGEGGGVTGGGRAGSISHVGNIII